MDEDGVEFGVGEVVGEAEEDMMVGEGVDEFIEVVGYILWWQGVDGGRVDVVAGEDGSQAFLGLFFDEHDLLQEGVV